MAGAVEDLVEDGAAFAFGFPDTVVQLASVFGISATCEDKI